MTKGLPLRHDDFSHSPSLSAYLRILRRRKWIVLTISLLIPLAVVLVSLRQTPVYRASAEVLVNQENLAATLSGIEDPGVWRDPARFMQTQVDLAQTPAVTSRVSNATRIALDALPRASVRARENSNILEFTVSHGDPATAEQLATEYANQFIRHRYEIDTAALKRAREEVAERMREVKRESGSKSSFYKNLREKEQQLRTMEALQTSNASLARAADDAVQTAPRPIRNGVLGLGLGLVFAVALAFLWETLDTRVRSAEEIGERLGLPLLARLPQPPRHLQRANKLVMAEEPSSLAAEAFRMLRTNLDFVALSRLPTPVGETVAHRAQGESFASSAATARQPSNALSPAGTASVNGPKGRPTALSIMVTSAVEKEGKSTTVANLGIAFARAGRRVVLVDLDLRRPFIHEFFGREPSPGVTDVALGEVDLAEAVAAALPPSSADKGTGAVNGREPLKAGVLEVLTSGSVPPDAGEFVATRALAEILAELREYADVVLIDAPPMLQVGDAMTLTASVDAVIVVARLGVVRRPVLGELRRLLDACPAEKLGFVATAADLDKAGGYTYAYGYGYHEGRPRNDAAARAVSLR